MPTKKVTPEEAYRVLRDIYNQPTFVKVLRELDTNPKARASAKKDTRAYLIAEGIKLPDDATAHFSSNRWAVKICFFFFCISFEHS